MVLYNDGEEERSIAFNVCDHAEREPSDGKNDFANILSGGKNTGDYKHLTSSDIADVKVELLGKSSLTNLADTKRPDIGLRLTYENSGFRCDKDHDF